MKKILSIAMALLMACMVGCGVPVRSVADETPASSMFVCVEKSGDWWVVYHADTGVMYTVSNGSHNNGNFALMVNPDGTPMVWEGK